MALTLWTGNEVYLYLTVAFIQVGVDMCTESAPASLVSYASVLELCRGALARCIQLRCTNRCPNVCLSTTAASL